MSKKKDRIKALEETVRILTTEIEALKARPTFTPLERTGPRYPGDSVEPTGMPWNTNRPYWMIDFTPMH